MVFIKSSPFNHFSYLSLLITIRPRRDRFGRRERETERDRPNRARGEWGVKGETDHLWRRIRRRRGKWEGLYLLVGSLLPLVTHSLRSLVPRVVMRGGRDRRELTRNRGAEEWGSEHEWRGWREACLTVPAASSYRRFTLITFPSHLQLILFGIFMLFSDNLFYISLQFFIIIFFIHILFLYLLIIIIYIYFSYIYYVLRLLFIYIKSDVFFLLGISLYERLIKHQI